MIIKSLGPILLAGAAAAAVTFAPTAGATGTSECQTSGPTPACTTSGTADVGATPDISTAAADYWPFNGGPNQPVWVLE